MPKRSSHSSSILQSTVGEFNFVVELDTPFPMKEEKGATSACFELFSDFGEREKLSSVALVYSIFTYMEYDVYGGYLLNSSRFLIVVFVTADVEILFQHRCYLHEHTHI